MEALKSRVIRKPPNLTRLHIYMTGMDKLDLMWRRWQVWCLRTVTITMLLTGSINFEEKMPVEPFEDPRQGLEWVEELKEKIMMP